MINNKITSVLAYPTNARGAIKTMCNAFFFLLSESTPLERCCVHNMSPFVSSSGLTPGSKRYHENFLLCNNNEITACIANLARFIADLSNSFCKEVYVVAFFKVVQKQTIGTVAN